MRSERSVLMSGQRTTRIHRRAPRRLLLVGLVLAVVSVACNPPAHVDSGGTKRVVRVPAAVPHGATCDASMPDASRHLQAWLSSLPNHTVALLDANQCYRAEYTLTLQRKTDVTLDGQGATLRAFTDGCDDQSNDGVRFNHCRIPPPTDGNGNARSWPQARMHMHLPRGNVDVTIKNLRIEGPKNRAGYEGSLAFQHGFALGDTDRVLIDNVMVDRVWGDYVYFARVDNKVSRNTTVQNSDFGKRSPFLYGTGRQGFAKG